MPEEFSVDPESLLRASARFSLESVELDAALARLRESLSALGDVCGDDEQGHTFGAAYKPNVAKLDKAMANLVEGLGGIGDAFDVMATNYLGGDSASQVRSR
ncbi:MAG: hypothetical protein E6I73_09295 [Chloroflexi bacterium]|nr:MAG: hypothetical protein E6I73_09295 [Chloroflexota bacterium]